MCLSIAVNFSDRVLNSGEHVGFEWAVTHNGSGFRCGYVRVPVGHPWHGKHKNDVTAKCHGSLTFAEKDKPCGKGEDDGWWLGFDCMHSDDAPDLNLPGGRSLGLPGEVRSQDYVESECRSLCEQAAAACGFSAEPSLNSRRMSFSEARDEPWEPGRWIRDTQLLHPRPRSIRDNRDEGWTRTVYACTFTWT